MRYDRAAAVGYARRFWDRPCDDGIFWRTDYAVDVAGMRKVLHAPAKDGWEARFVPDGAGAEHAVFKRDTGDPNEIEIQPWDGLADCAHFLSRCLSAGGFAIKEISVPKLVNHLKGRGDTKVLAERVTRERGQGIVDTGILKKGDMLGYFNISPEGDYGGRRQYSHGTMFIGKIRAGDEGRITCHTKRGSAVCRPSPTSGIWTIPRTSTRSSTSRGTTSCHLTWRAGGCKAGGRATKVAADTTICPPAATRASPCARRGPPTIGRAPSH
jgi:hypothetical protein